MLKTIKGLKMSVFPKIGVILSAQILAFSVKGGILEKKFSIFIK